MLQLGIASVDITPSRPTPLGGFGHRPEPFEDVAHRIKVRALVFQREGVRGAVLSADHVGWTSELVEALRPRIEEAIGVTPELLLLHATHTHCGPQLRNQAPVRPAPDEEYLAELEDHTVDGARRAAADLAPVTNVSLSHAKAGFGIHRRLKVDGEVIMAPNPGGPTDPVVTVVRFDRGGGRPPALLVHFTCHPTTSDQKRVSPDYPGTAMDLLEPELGEGSVALFLQGHCGDIRPALVKDGRFFRGTQEDIDRFAAEFATSVRGALDGEQTPLSEGPIEGRREVVELPFSRLPEQRELEEHVAKGDGDAKWARLLLSNPERWRSGHVLLDVSWLTLCQGLELLALNAEPVVAYGFFVRGLKGGTVLPVGYSNGQLGYLATAAQLAEGGYEGVGSTKGGLPSPLVLESERLARDAIQRVVTGSPARA